MHTSPRRNDQAPPTSVNTGKLAVAGLQLTGRLCPITRQIQIDLVIHGSGRVYCTPPLPVAPTTIPGKRTVTSVAHQAETAVQVHNSTPEQPICWPSVTSMTQHTNTYHANNTTSEARHTRLSTRAHCYYEMTLLTDLFHMRTRLFSGKDKRASPSNAAGSPQQHNTQQPSAAYRGHLNSRDKVSTYIHEPLVCKCFRKCFRFRA